MYIRMYVRVRRTAVAMVTTLARQAEVARGQRKQQQQQQSTNVRECATKGCATAGVDVFEKRRACVRAVHV